jgi:hypothetical protein
MKPSRFSNFALILLIAIGVTIAFFLLNKIFSKEISPDEISLETYLRIDTDSVVSIRKIWIPYYHRHKKIDEAGKVLEILVRESSLTATERLFFTILLHDNSDFRNNMVQSLDKYYVTINLAGR